METSVNNKCKAFTSLEQSKKLAEFLPCESADIRYHTVSHYNPYPCDEIIYTMDFGRASGKDIPCWSLAALFDLIPSKIYDNNDNYAYLWVNKDKDEQQNKDNHYLAYHDPYDDFEHIETNQYDNFVDACYDMILKLHELKLI